VPLEQLAPDARDCVRKVLERPTLSSRGPAESFYSRPAVYRWLLDHPDQAARLWRRLGAECPEIRCEGPGRFWWFDRDVGELRWQTVLDGAHHRIWYAEGKVRGAPWLPAVTVRAVVVLLFADGEDGAGRTMMRHQMDLVLHTDSRALNLAARLFGSSAPRLAEQYIAQMEMFFGGLAWYLSDNPDRAQALFRQLGQNEHPGS
jgi:hypothetical protein